MAASTENASELGDSFVKLRFDLTLSDWFAPFNNATLDAADADLGSSGVLLIPGTDLLLGGGKEGKLYVLSRNDLGHFNAGDYSQIVQSFYVNPGHEIHGGPLFWSGPLGPCVYVWPESDFLNTYRFRAGSFQTIPVSVSTTTTPGTGIVWACHPYDKDANQQVVSGIVYAYDASDLTKEMWNSKQNSARDDPR